MKYFLKQNWYWIGIILVLISALFSMCNNNHVKDKDTIKYVTVNSVKEIPVHDTILKKLHEVKTVTKYVDKIKIDTIKILYKDSIPCEFNRSGELKTKEYIFTYQSDNKGFKIGNMIIEDSLIIVTGTKRKWFLGRETNIIDISHSNKYIVSDNIQHFEVKEKKKFYDTNLFMFGVGFIAGVAIMK